MQATVEERTLTFPWAPENPFRVRIIRYRQNTAVVQTVNPEPGRFTGQWPAPREWLS